MQINRNINKIKPPVCIYNKVTICRQNHLSQRFFRSSVIFKRARGSESKKLGSPCAVDTFTLTTEEKARGAECKQLRKTATTESKDFFLL